MQFMRKYMFPLSSVLDSLSHTTTHLTLFHEGLIVLLTFILTIVGGAILTVISSKAKDRFTIEGHRLETFWTIMPGTILVALAIPSVRLLYAVDTDWKSPLSIKVTGHQWYWTYAYPESPQANLIEFDSFILPTEELNLGDYRLLEATPRAVLPSGYPTNIIVTSIDVIHSWAVPSLGVKLDAIPGRLNQAELIITRPGVYYGQCSEICGANHSFMPITVESVPISSFTSWLNQFI